MTAANPVAGMDDNGGRAEDAAAAADAAVTGFKSKPPVIDVEDSGVSGGNEAAAKKDGTTGHAPSSANPGGHVSGCPPLHPNKQASGRIKRKRGDAVGDDTVDLSASPHDSVDPRGGKKARVAGAGVAAGDEQSASAVGSAKRNGRKGGRDKAGGDGQKADDNEISTTTGKRKRTQVTAEEDGKGQDVIGVAKGTVDGSEAGASGTAVGDAVLATGVESADGGGGYVPATPVTGEKREAPMKKAKLMEELASPQSSSPDLAFPEPRADELDGQAVAVVTDMAQNE
ncbi:unnamed protein product, partial [Sphacelaria rigidula]